MPTSKTRQPSRTSGHSGLPVTILRGAPDIKLSPFTDYFLGFEQVEAVRRVFGSRTEEVLGKLKVGFVSNRYMYMGVRDSDGNLSVGTYHLKTSDLRTLYLDIVHELFHVKQFMEDKEYFRREHRKYLENGFDASLYFRSPIEVPAYKHAVEEAKRIGMSYDEITEYLKMGPVEPKVFSRLLKDVDLDDQMAKSTSAKLPVRINRDARVPLYPFTDYFKGFEKLAAVRALFGAHSGEVLDRLKIEFSSMPINAVFLEQDEGHLQVSTNYLRTGDARLLFTDIIVCLNMLKRMSVGRPALGPGQDLSDTPIFVESFRAGVTEGRRIGLSKSELIDHMSVARFLLAPSDFRGFLKQVGLK